MTESKEHQFTVLQIDREKFEPLLLKLIDILVGCTHPKNAEVMKHASAEYLAKKLLGVVAAYSATPKVVNESDIKEIIKKHQGEVQNGPDSIVN